MGDLMSNTMVLNKPMAPAPRAPPAMQLDLTKYKPDPNDPSLNPKSWEKRADGTQKGKGFLGLLKRPDGKVSSEISIGIEINGKEVEIPTIVPTLTQQELDFLLTNDPKTKIPKSIIDKAIEHAKQRMAKGLSPFAD